MKPLDRLVYVLLDLIILVTCVRALVMVGL
jgi:hypothetical protein